MLDITLLGTSALVPLPDRAETSALLQCMGHSILFDCGEGTQTAARKAGVSLFKTDIIALTHYHGDHIFGLPGLLQTLSILGRTQPMVIIGPGDAERELRPILSLAGQLPYPVVLRGLPPEGAELNALCSGWPAGARLVPIPTVHRVISQGYAFLLPRPGQFLPTRAEALGLPRKLWGSLQAGHTVQWDGCEITPAQVLGPQRQGLKVVFSGDTARCDSLAEGARAADLFLCEATYGEDEQAELASSHGHMNFAQAAQTAARAGAKRLWLMHYSQMIEEPQEYLPKAAVHFPNAECGVDGMHITLEFPEKRDTGN